MSSIETRRNPASGTVSHRVRFRYEGKNKAVPFDTAEQAQAWRTILDTMGAKVALTLLTDPDPTSGATVADLIAHHIDHLTGVEEGTTTRYRNYLRDHLGPHFSHILAADLTRDDVATWVNTARLKNGKQPAPKTLRNWHSLLSDALSSAVRDGKLPANAAKGVRLPSRDALADDDMILLTRHEVDLILAALPEQWRALVLTLVLTGVRWGEATALTVGALDPATRSARIHTAWKQSGKTGGPKSRRSRRTVAVPEAVFAALEPHLAGKAPGDLVFLSPRGYRVRSGNFWNGPWSRAVAQVAPIIGKEPRVHDLRHTFASWAIQAGIPLPVIQRQLGHESITTTVDTYGHLARSDFDPLLSLGAGLTMPPVPPAIEGSASPDGPAPA